MNKIKNIEFVGVALQGIDHVKKNIPLQDYVFSKTSNNTTVISLADGATSYKKTEVGAKISTEFISNFICDNFQILFKENNATTSERLLDGIRSELTVKANQLGLNIEEHDLGSTLLFVAVHNNQYLAGHLGDGVIGYFENQEPKVLSKPENDGEYGQYTYLTTSHNAQSHFRVYKGEIDKIHGFILMSDGTCDSLYIKKENKLAPPNITMLEWLQENEKSSVEKEIHNAIQEVFLQRSDNGDDCSINLLTLTRNENIMDKDTKIDKQIDLNELANNVAKNKAKIEKLEDDFSSVKKQSQSIQSAHDKKINDIKGNIDSLKHRFKDVEKRLSAKSESVDVEPVVTDHSLDNKVNTLTILVVINFIILLFLLFIILT